MLHVRLVHATCAALICHMCHFTQPHCRMPLSYCCRPRRKLPISCTPTKKNYCPNSQTPALPQKRTNVHTPRLLHSQTPTLPSSLPKNTIQKTKNIGFIWKKRWILLHFLLVFVWFSGVLILNFCICPLHKC